MVQSLSGEVGRFQALKRTSSASHPAAFGRASQRKPFRTQNQNSQRSQALGHSYCYRLSLHLSFIFIASLSLFFRNTLISLGIVLPVNPVKGKEKVHNLILNLEGFLWEALPKQNIM